MESGPQPGGITRDDWLTALKEADAASQQLPESDALTVKEFAAMMGIHRLTATTKLADLAARGKAEKTTKAIRRSNGTILNHVPAYRLLK